MISTLKAEFRKLLTVRSTYLVTALMLAFVIFIAFYIDGWRLSGITLMDPNALAGDVLGALNLTVFGAIVAILLATHEYRYNTIMYTLTASNSRTKVLISKFIVISAYSLFLAVLVGVLSPIMSHLGIHIHGNTLVPQTFHFGDLAWRSLFYGWGYGMAGLLIALLLRSQVAAIAALFLIPSIAEQLLSLLLRKNAVYLPFTALSQVIDSGMARAGGGSLTPGRAALTFGCYLLVGWIAAWILFLWRDAN
jgi:ABC-2 type transport system permease protein